MNNVRQEKGMEGITQTTSFISASAKKPQEQKVLAFVSEYRCHASNTLYRALRWNGIDPSISTAQYWALLDDILRLDPAPKLVNNCHLTFRERRVNPGDWIAIAISLNTYTVLDDTQFQKLFTLAKRDCLDPWHPMSDPVDLKHIGKLLEEVNELGSAAARCQIQGIDECEPTTGKPNREWFEDEMGDVIANIALNVKHFELDMERILKRAEHKANRLRAWHEMA